MKVLIHYGEIGLKGKNIGFFENTLVRNIKNKLKVENVEKNSKRFILDIKESRIKIEKKLKTIFGISSFSFIEEVESKEDKIVAKVTKIIKDFKEVNLKTSRSDKNFPLTSVELNKKIGDEAYKLGIKINFSCDNKVFTEITTKKTYIYYDKIRGLGGLPVGSSGRVLCLFSGGIDSAVAAYYMMKRGCKVDFVHVHVFPNNKDVLKSKIKEIIEILEVFQWQSKLYLVPYSSYQMKTIDEIDMKYEVVAFKNFMLRLGQEVAIENDYKALITGDSVGQVASQTLENLNASRVGIHLPILSPLIGFDKQDIIDKARDIDTYDKTIEPYRDCCSIVARKPGTKIKVEDIKKVLEKIKVDELVKESLEVMESF